MTTAERAIAGALTLALAASAPTPPASGPRYVWVAQDAGAPTPDASAGDAGMTPEQRAAALERALRDYEQARKRRESSQ